MIAFLFHLDIFLYYSFIFLTFFFSPLTYSPKFTFLNISLTVLICLIRRQDVNNPNTGCVLCCSLETLHDTSLNQVRSQLLPLHELVQEMVGPGVAPHYGGVERLAGQSVPHNGRLPLVGYTCKLHI